MPKEDLSNMRGLSDPMFFEFNISKDRQRMLVHGVIFSSFEISKYSDKKIGILELDKDPRMRAFVKFVWVNYLKENRAMLKELVRIGEGKATALAAEIAELEHKMSAHADELAKVEKENDEQ